MRKSRALAVAVASLLIAAGCGSKSSPSTAAAVPSGVQAESGTAIPTVAVKAGFSPIGDGLIPVIGSRLGYFKDVGISFAAGTEGLKTNLLGSLTPLLNGQIDIGDTYEPLVTPQLDSVKTVTSFAFATTFHGTMVLAPKGKYLTLSTALAAGMSFPDAARKVMAQMRDQKLLLFTGADPEFYSLALAQAGLTLSDTKTSYLSDPDMVIAANAGQAQFVSPNGAVQISQLLHSGWEPLIQITDLIKALPAQTLSLSNTQTGFVTTDDYAAKNYNTILRFTSVLFRIVHDLQTDPEKAAAVYVDYVNSYTGSTLTATEAAQLYTGGLYTLNPFETYAGVVSTPGSGNNYYESTQGQIERLKAKGVLKTDPRAANIAIAQRVFNDLLMYKKQTEELLPKITGSMKDKAEQYFKDYDFLDAYRFAVAADKTS